MSDNETIIQDQTLNEFEANLEQQDMDQQFSFLRSDLADDGNQTVSRVDTVDLEMQQIPHFNAIGDNEDNDFKQSHISNNTEEEMEEIRKKVKMHIGQERGARDTTESA